MKNSTSVKQLKLDSCNIDDEGMTILSQFLPETLTLTDLELQRNIFGPRGAQELAMVLKSNKSIENIVLIGCTTVGEEGTQRLLQGLAVNQTVQTLFLPLVYEKVTEPENPHVSTRMAWLPDVVLKDAVDLSWSPVNPQSLG